MENQNGLLAGFAKIDITPKHTVGLTGYSNSETRLSEGVAEPIYLTCIALTDGDDTVLVYTADSGAIASTMGMMVGEAAQKATGISCKNVFIAATHSHNCPPLLGKSINVEKTRAQFLQAVADSAKMALEDRTPAKIFATKRDCPGMNFVRHVILENGKCAMWDWQKEGSPFVKYASPTDPEMTLIKFAREGKKDILLVNWQGHPDNSSQIGFHLIAPGFVGPLRDTLAAGSGMEVAYFTGADGNEIIDSIVPEHRHRLNWRRYGVKMAELALEVLDDMVPVEGSGISASRAKVEVENDHTTDYLLPQANEVYDYWKATDKTAGTKLAEKYGFSTVYQTRAIRIRAQLPATNTLEVGAFRVGGVGFVTGTYEMFSRSGMQLKKESPYEFTMILTGNWTYIPDKESFKYRCYESDTGFYTCGTAEKLVDKQLELLRQVQ